MTTNTTTEALDHPPLPAILDFDSPLWAAIARWSALPSGREAELEVNNIEAAIVGYMHAYVDADRAARATAPGAPIDMVLYCPNCGAQHIDMPEPNDCMTHNDQPGANITDHDWDNPPHRSHLCHGCGNIWRPADVPTNGVQAIKTIGKADTWPAPHNEEVQAIRALASPASPAPTVAEASATLARALRDSKGWLMDYAQAVISDAIDRVPAAPASGVLSKTDAIEVIEQIAKEWDGCEFDAPGGMIDIGDAIRRDFNNLYLEGARPQAANLPFVIEGDKMCWLDGSGSRTCNNEERALWNSLKQAGDRCEAQARSNLEMLAAKKSAPAKVEGDAELLDWLEKNFACAEGQIKDKRSGTGRVTDYIYWGRQTGASGSIREAIRAAISKEQKNG